MQSRSRHAIERQRTSRAARCKARLKVLIVDDEYYTRKVIRTLLLAIGVHQDPRGQRRCRSGLDAIRTLAPDVVLLDWEMPGMDGAEFVRRGALARQLSLSERADHHADRPRRALARARGGAARRARIPAQAGVEQRAARAHRVGAHQAAHHGAGAATITGRSRASSSTYKPETTRQLSSRDRGRRHELEPASPRLHDIRQ